jgi:hypothetical protein
MSHSTAVPIDSLSPMVEPKLPPAWLIRLVNPILRPLLRSPLAARLGEGLVLLEFTGRRSGRAYAFPLMATRDGDDLLVATGKPWKHNLQGGVPAAVVVGGRRQRVIADLVEDPAALEGRYATMLAANPSFARFIGLRIGADGRPLPEDVRRAAATGQAVVVLRPAAG